MTPALVLLLAAPAADHKPMPAFGWSYYRLPEGPTVLPPIGPGHKPGPALYSPILTPAGPVNPPHPHRYGLGWFGFRSPSPRPLFPTVDPRPSGGG